MDKDLNDKLLRQIRDSQIRTEEQIKTLFIGTEKHQTWCKEIQDKVTTNTRSIDRMHGATGIIALVVSAGVGLCGYWLKR